MEKDDEYDELYDEEEGDDNDFNLGICLPPPVARLYTTKELHELIHQGIIDLNPPYQREVVWPEAKQIKLLDSLWRNYYLPPIVFAVYKDEDGEEIYNCVDGKQRLTSIQKFLDGQIPYKHHKTGKSWWYKTSNTHKKTRREVSQRWKDDFCSKTLTCVNYQALDPIRERDIFQRVQLGVALSAAEKLQAIPSPRTEFIAHLQARYILQENNLAEKIDVAIKRGQDFQLLAGLVYLCDQYPAQVHPSSKNLENWLSAEDGTATLREDFKDDVRDVMTAFWHIADDDALNTAFRQIAKRVAPAEFVFTGLLLYALRDASYEDRAQAIFDMRTHIRGKYADIRMRGDIMKELWNFVEDAVESVPVQGSSAGGPAKGKKGKKAARAHDDDDDDFEMGVEDEYRPKKQAKKQKRN